MRILPSFRELARRAVSIVLGRPLTAALSASALVIAGGAGVAGVDALLPMTATAATATTTRSSGPTDMDGIFDARSPGGRHYGWLVNDKSPRTGFDVGPPAERVLSSVRRRPGAPVPGGATPALYTPVAGVPPTVLGPSGGPVDGPLDGVVTGGNTPFAPTGGFLAGIPGVVGTAPGAGGGGGSGPTVGAGDPGTVVVPAVPEPATWTMLLLGFFVMGSILRRAPARRPHEAL